MSFGPIAEVNARPFTVGEFQKILDTIDAELQPIKPLAPTTVPPYLYTTRQPNLSIAAMGQIVRAYFRRAYPHDFEQQAQGLANFMFRYQALMKLNDSGALSMYTVSELDGSTWVHNCIYMAAATVPLDKKGGFGSDFFSKADEIRQELGA